MVRYADDAVLGFERQEDAERVFAVLAKRFEICADLASAEDPAHYAAVSVVFMLVSARCILTAIGWRLRGFRVSLVAPLSGVPLVWGCSRSVVVVGVAWFTVPSDAIIKI